MIEFILMDNNSLFLASVFSVFLFLIIELFLLTVSGFSLIVGFDFPDMDIDTDFGSSIANWLHLGRVPAFAILISFLCTFGSVGFVVQLLYFYITHSYLTLLVSSLISLFLSVVLMNVILDILIKVFFFKSEEVFCTPESLVLSDAVILSPVLNKNIMAEAELVLPDNTKRKIYVKTRSLTLSKGDISTLKEYDIKNGVYYM